MCFHGEVFPFFLSGDLAIFFGMVNLGFDFGGVVGILAGLFNGCSFKFWFLEVLIICRCLLAIVMAYMKKEWIVCKYMEDKKGGQRKLLSASNCCD